MGVPNADIMLSTPSVDRSLELQMERACATVGARGFNCYTLGFHHLANSQYSHSLDSEPHVALTFSKLGRM